MSCRHLKESKSALLAAAIVLKVSYLTLSWDHQRDAKTTA